MKLNKELVAELRRRIVSVTFTKKDGTPRKMLCTLNEALIPDEHTPKGTGPRVIVEDEDPENVRVFDVEVNGWRTIIFDNITNVELAG
jgi:hypothetical protein